MNWQFGKRLARIERKLDAIMRAQNLEIEMEFEQMVDLSNITREVEETRGATASTKVLVKGLYAKIKELKSNNPAEQAKIDELAASLQASQDELASAVEENPAGSTGGF